MEYYSAIKRMNNVICSNMDATRVSHTRSSKKEKDTTRYHLYVESKTWQKWTYLQNRNKSQSFSWDRTWWRMIWEKEYTHTHTHTHDWVTCWIAEIGTTLSINYKNFFLNERMVLVWLTVISQVLQKSQFHPNSSPSIECLFRIPFPSWSVLRLSA